MRSNVHKSRSNFGLWLDKQEDLTISALEKASDISYVTISKLCKDQNYLPRLSTIAKVNKGLKTLGKDIDLKDFFAKEFY
ncbi:transcriptional regulator [Paenisporosarcina sp. NPDC076907]|uniref:transcriptional regulator n=1 Tax=Paenisporosarcina sp. NPDC076907 TaxID=3390604 RepID=UPI003D08A9A8